MNTCNTVGMGYSVLQCVKIQYCTHTHSTRFGNTVGISVPVLNPKYIKNAMISNALKAQK